MRISVTKEHVDNGKVKDSQSCMIADAIKQACPKAQYIMVDLQSIRFTDKAKRKRYIYLTPAVAQHNLIRFDQGDSVKPFTFSLTTPARAQTIQTTRTSERVKASNRKATKKYRTNRKKADYAYLAANRARNHQKEREFGLRKFVE
jgi:hypothetical protein